MAITVKLAETEEEKFQVYRLRYQVYVEEDEKFEPNPERIIKDPYDDLEVSQNVLAHLGQEPVGTARITQDIVGLPPEDMMLYDPYTKVYLPIDCADLRENHFDPRLMNVGMLAIKKEHQKKMGLLKSLISYLTFLAFSSGGENLMVIVNYKIEKMMKNLGMENMSRNPLWEEHINNYVVPLQGKIRTLAENINYREPPFDIFEAPEIPVRRLYKQGEVICKEGDVGQEAFVVSRGSVSAIKETGECSDKLLATIDPEEIVGEMTLLDGKPRSATLKSNSKETEVIIIPRSTLEKSLQNLKKFVHLLSFFEERLENMNITFANQGSSSQDPLYSENPDLARKNSSSCQKRKFFSAGELICQEGNRGKESWMIKEGEVEVLRQDQPIKIVGKGEIIGETAMINKSRTASLKAKTDVVLLTWEKVDFVKFLQENWEIKKQCLKTVLYRIREMNDLVGGSTTQEETAKRVVHALTFLSSQRELLEQFDSSTRTNNNEKEVFDLEWLASETGVPKTEIETMLEQLKRKNIVQISKTGDITVKKPQELKSFKFLTT